MKQPIANAVLHGTVLSLKLLEKFMRADIQIRCEETLPNNPILFVVNHFTRVETILLPYIIKKATGHVPNSLAHSSLFSGKLGDYLTAVGALSIDDQDRNNIITGDLITGRKNWIIFPEGAMIKTKKVIRSRHLAVHHPEREGNIHTGSAYLAILSELYKKAIRSAHAKGDKDRTLDCLSRFSIETVDEISPEETVIVPTNLTYFPLRPGKNIIQSLTSRFIKEIPERLDEELEIEWNLLFSGSHIHVTFGRPIRIKEFLDRRYLRTNTPFSAVIAYQRRLFCGDDPACFNLSRISRRLTNHFMDKIYSMVTVNVDHLFSSGLLSLNRKITPDYVFKCKLFLACEEIKKQKKFKLHTSLERSPFGLVADERDDEYDNFEALAVKTKIIEKRDGDYFIDKGRLEADYDFHRVRVENTVRVIANEIEAVPELCRIIRKEFRRPAKKVRARMVDCLSRLDQEIFKDEYHRYYHEELSKPEQVGAPFHLNPRKADVGVLVCHGYMAAPEEVRPLGDYLAKCGYSVYGPRLQGHGTSPYNLVDVVWRDWYDSFNRGYAILRNTCEHVIIGGFSTGGALALLAAANKDGKIDGLFSVNAPLQLKSIKTKLTGPIHLWNELLEKFSIEEGKLEFVDNEPENPEINYTKNSIKGVRELGRLMDRCREVLNRIHVPTLVIQEKNDPVVDPRSAATILDGISSKEKEFYAFEYNRHGILRREGSDEVFLRIREFIERVIGSLKNKNESKPYVEN